MHTLTPLPSAPTQAPGQVLKGQYIGAFRSEKGKLKGLRLRTATGLEVIELPKYLRPMLVRELQPAAFIQVWAYPEAGRWRAVNLLPLPASEIAALALIEETEQPLAPAPVCLQVCRRGSCSKRGSDRLWQALQAEIAADPDLKAIALEASGCLKNCKQGPTVRLLPSGETLSFAQPQRIKTRLKQQLNLLTDKTQSQESLPLMH
ncbi:MAG: (2Fe-2S) ferredoxin domain-containing protein [Almyronema sp.]